MRFQRLTIVIPLMICLLTASAYALSIKTGYAAKTHPSGAMAVFHWKASSPGELPNGATIYTKDNSAFYFKRVGVDSSFVPMPANNSILFPRSAIYTFGDSFVFTVLVAGHTDTTIGLGWGE